MTKEECHKILQLLQNLTVRIRTAEKQKIQALQELDEFKKTIQEFELGPFVSEVAVRRPSTWQCREGKQTGLCDQLPHPRKERTSSETVVAATDRASSQISGCKQEDANSTILAPYPIIEDIIELKSECEKCLRLLSTSCSDQSAVAPAQLTTSGLQPLSRRLLRLHQTCRQHLDRLAFTCPGEATPLCRAGAGSIPPARRRVTVSSASAVPVWSSPPTLVTGRQKARPDSAPTASYTHPSTGCRKSAIASTNASTAGGWSGVEVVTTVRRLPGATPRCNTSGLLSSTRRQPLRCLQPRVPIQQYQQRQSNPAKSAGGSANPMTVSLLTPLSSCQRSGCRVVWK